MCAVPCTEWGVESPSHILFCCDTDIFSPPINKCRLFKNKYINRGRFAHTFCDIAKPRPAVNSLLFAAAEFLTDSKRLHKNVAAIKLNITRLPCNWQNTDRNLFQFTWGACKNIKAFLICFNSYTVASRTYTQRSCLVTGIYT